MAEGSRTKLTRIRVGIHAIWQWSLGLLNAMIKTLLFIDNLWVYMSIFACLRVGKVVLINTRLKIDTCVNDIHYQGLSFRFIAHQTVLSQY